MGETREFVVQTRLGPEKKRQTYYFFTKETMIFPENSGRGVLTTDLQAKKEEEQEVKGFQAWKAEGAVHLYLDKNHWQLSSGSRFGAPVTSAKQRKV